MTITLSDNLTIEIAASGIWKYARRWSMIANGLEIGSRQVEPCDRQKPFINCIIVVS